MRLINTSTLQLEEFFDDEIPKYAILSHTWTKEEVTLQEWEKSEPSTKLKAGYCKVRDACAISKRGNHDWLWADTVCIDKKSSADLSEAINSMYAWYCGSEECLAYLVDVDSTILADEGKLADFTKSRWFTRGWTVQELVAPNHLTFYDQRWRRIGSKTDYEEAIEAKTGIEIDHIALQKVDQRDIPVARRMSWFARRKTSRVEDVAYCMMGIFDINMPLIYGEGKKAFLRLQHEIIRKENDQTILTWVKDPSLLEGGVLASSPAAFAEFGDLAMPSIYNASGVPHLITNFGLSIRLPLSLTAKGMFAYLETQENSEDWRRGPLLYRCWGIVLEHSRRFHSDKPLLRASRPNRPLRICKFLPIPPLTDTFLGVEPGKPMSQGYIMQDRNSGCLRKYGLFLLFGNPEDTRSLKIYAYPTNCLLLDGLLTFPENDESWSEHTAEADGEFCRVRSTMIILCVERSSTEPRDMIRTYIFFTLSIVTKERAGHVAIENVVFGGGIQLFETGDGGPSNLQTGEQYDLQNKGDEAFDKSSKAAGLPYSFDAQHWIRRKPDMMKIFEQETRQLLEKETQHLLEQETQSLPEQETQQLPGQCQDGWNTHAGNKLPEENVITVGCCDANYPGFKEVRMVYISIPRFLQGVNIHEVIK